MNDEPKTFCEAAQRLGDAERAFFQSVLEIVEPLLMPLCIRLTRGIEWLTKHLSN